MRAIVAMDPNRVIGYKGKIPWHFSADLKWFKEFTMGSVVVMGRKAYLSIEQMYLPGRKLMVLSRTMPPARYREENFKTDELGYPHKNPDSIQWYIRDVQEPIDAGLCTRNELIIAGGREIYEKFLPEITEFYVTHVFEEYDGDTTMPDFEDLLPNMELLRETKDFCIVKHTK